MSNFDSTMEPEWQTKHLFSKIGSMSFEYSRGSLRLRSTVGIGGRPLDSFFSWVGAKEDAASSMAIARKQHERMGNSEKSPRTAVRGLDCAYFTTLKFTLVSWTMACLPSYIAVT